jgi:integrase
MTRKATLPHVNEFVDRYNKTRRYVRRNGKSVALTLPPDDPGFVAQYQEALKATEHKPYRAAAGTWDALCDEFLCSAGFGQLSKRNQIETKREVKRIQKRWGDKPVDRIERRHIEKWQDELAANPGKANNMLSCIKKLLTFAERRDYVKKNPALGISKLKMGEHRSWTDDELAKFEAQWAPGTRERLAYALALYTGQRKGDLLAMTWGHVRRDVIAVAQQKTGARLVIPIHPNLREVLGERGAATSNARLLPLKSRHFGAVMADAIETALGDDSDCVLHGLRKAAARKLAEAGCTAHEIMSITGHETLAMVQKYARAASQERLARSAIGKLQNDSGILQT